MREGDILLGMSSSGVHSNGFSLVRKIVERSGLSFHDTAPWAPEQNIGTALLTPTKIYVKPLLAAVRKDLLKGMAHITGGGLSENIPRMLPRNLAAELDAKTWPLPEVFKWLKKTGALEAKEFQRTFNTGLGMVIVVAPEKAKEASEFLQSQGESVYEIGRLVARGEEEVVINNMEVWG